MIEDIYRECMGVNLKLAEAIAYAELGDLEKINEYKRFSFKKLDNFIIIEYTPLNKNTKISLRKYNYDNFISIALFAFIDVGLIREEDFREYKFTINHIEEYQDTVKENEYKVNIEDSKFNIEDSVKGYGIIY